jgi:hypothetical protein
VENQPPAEEGEMLGFVKAETTIADQLQNDINYQFFAID